MAYSSKYYDPAKAHEYYEKHKELKGRTSTSGLNEKGKAAAKMVKDNLKAQKKAELEKLSGMLKDQLKNIREKLKEKLKGLSKEQKAKIREEYKAKIGALRDTVKTAKENTKQYYSNAVEAEMAKIKADSSMLKTKKGKSKKKR